MDMVHEIMQFFRLSKEFRNTDYFDTEETRRISKEIFTLVESSGQLVALTGIVGSGKTTICTNIRQLAKKNRKVAISTSWAVEKDKVKMGTLMAALFTDLAVDKRSKIPTSAEKRERRLCELIKKQAKPVALFIDEAHDLHSKTLLGLKRLTEVVRQNGGNLSIVLVGLPKLAITLKNPAFEEIGTRVHVLTLDLIAKREKDFIEWMLNQCAKPKVKSHDIFSQQAIDILAEKLKTPLQIIYYSWRALEVSYRSGNKTVDPQSVKKALAPTLNGLEANLARQGYSEKSLCENLDIKRAEIRSFLKGKLSQNRTEDIYHQLLRIGILTEKTA
jgi:type II secretory pathway predicted ATPase ExeA